MKKKGILGFALLIVLIIGIVVFSTIALRQNTDTELSVSFKNDFAVVGEKIEIKITGAKKNKCEVDWYIDEQWIENDEKYSYLVTNEDLEKIIEVKVKYKDQEVSTSMYISKLPVFYFSSKNSVGEMYNDAYLKIQGNDEYKDTELYDGNVSIKLRGNSTKHRDKKPYKLELENKTDLFGFGASKDWVLLAEDIDHTLVRNRLVMYFAKELGMEYTGNATSVVLFWNNKYQGVYTLIEQVRVGENQVDITDYRELSEKLARKIVLQDAIDEGVIEKGEKKEADSLKSLLEKYDLLDNASKLKATLYSNLSWLSEPYEVVYKKKSYCAADFVDIPKLNGGWLLEGDFYSSSTDPNSVKTAYKQPLYFNTPVEGYSNQELYQNVKKYIQTFEYALHSEDFTYHEEDIHLRPTGGKFNWMSGWDYEEEKVNYSDKEHDGMRYDELFDMDSLVNYFLVCEFTRNWDSMKNSTFVYKEVDEKACMGPVWDYDWAFGNINMYNINTYFPKGWQTTDIYFSNEYLFQAFNWNRYLIKDEIFVNNLYKKYWEIRDSLIEDIISENGLLATWKEEMYEAGKANDARWKYSYKAYHSYGYEYSWNLLNDFIEKRVKWLDEQFKDEETLYKSLNSYLQYEFN